MISIIMNHFTSSLGESNDRIVAKKRSFDLQIESPLSPAPFRGTSISNVHDDRRRRS